MVQERECRSRPHCTPFVALLTPSDQAQFCYKYQGFWELSYHSELLLRLYPCVLSSRRISCSFRSLSVLFILRLYADSINAFETNVQSFLFQTSVALSPNRFLKEAHHFHSAAEPSSKYRCLSEVRNRRISSIFGRKIGMRIDSKFYLDEIQPHKKCVVCTFEGWW